MALTTSELEARFGPGRQWTSPAGDDAWVWSNRAYQLLWRETPTPDNTLSRLWQARKGRSADVVVVIAPSDRELKLRVVGPREQRLVRELATTPVLRWLEEACEFSPRETAAHLAREFNRLAEAVVTGLRVKDLLTPHFVRERLSKDESRARLDGATAEMPSGDGGWRSLFSGFGYQVEQLPRRGYLLRHNQAPVVVVHPHRDPSLFGRLTDNGELPEGMALVDCQAYGAHWAVLAAGDRFRLYQRQPPVGSAAAQFLEFDARELGRERRFYLGLLSPESLKEDGWLTDWVVEARGYRSQSVGGRESQGLETRSLQLSAA